MSTKPEDAKFSGPEALRDWRKFWETEYSDDLTLTGKQAHELCEALDIPFDGKAFSAPLAQPTPEETI